MDTSTSTEVKEQPIDDVVEQEEDTSSQDSVSDVGTSATRGENSEQETKPEEQKGSLDDYLGESSNKENWQKRYSDSSREALKLYEENKSYKQRVEELEAEIASYRDQTNINNTSDSEERLKKLEERLFLQEKEENNRIIQDFERENGITSEDRSLMKPIVTPLVREGFSLEKALKIAWNTISQESTSSVQKAKEAGKLEAYAETRTLDQASYREVGSTSKEPKSDDLPRLTRSQYEQAVKMGAVDAKGNVSKSFLQKLKEVRSQ